jgi:hypothetical protein
MEAVDRSEGSWETGDYLTSLDRFFEFETMEEWKPEAASDSFVADWNLKRAA